MNGPQAIEQGSYDGARIFAQNAIRKKNERLNFLRLAARIDAVCTQLNASLKMNQVTANMASITKLMGPALESMNIEKISEVMDKFESQFEDLQVRTDYVHQAMDQTTSLSTPAEEVDTLLSEVGDEYKLDVGQALVNPAATVPQPAEAEKAQQQPEEDDLVSRLRALQNP